MGSFHKRVIPWLLCGHIVIWIYECYETSLNLSLTICVAALRTGQLVKDEYYTLFESVAALEVRLALRELPILCRSEWTPLRLDKIMDPKMDSGFLMPGERLNDNYDVLQDLLPEQVVGIMDQLLCYEVGRAFTLGFRSVFVDSRHMRLLCICSGTGRLNVFCYVLF